MKKADRVRSYLLVHFVHCRHVYTAQFKEPQAKSK